MENVKFNNRKGRIKHNDLPFPKDKIIYISINVLLRYCKMEKTMILNYYLFLKI